MLLKLCYITQMPLRGRTVRKVRSRRVSRNTFVIAETCVSSPCMILLTSSLSAGKVFEGFPPIMRMMGQQIVHLG